MNEVPRGTVGRLAVAILGESAPEHVANGGVVVIVGGDLGAAGVDPEPDHEPRNLDRRKLRTSRHSPAPSNEPLDTPQSPFQNCSRPAIRSHITG